MDKLLNKELLIEEEQNEIRNYIGNITPMYSYDYEWQNPIHIGIILSLLVTYEYHELEPFYYNFRENNEESKKSEEINKKHADELIRILDLSRNN
jgi:hypothetical protein